MQSLIFERTNGNVPRKLAGEDHISGIMFYTDTLPWDCRKYSQSP